MPASHRDETIRLSSLGLTPTRGGDVAVTGLCLDSRKIKQGEVFAALAGSHAHGASYVQAVLAAGASAILTDPEGAKIIGDLGADHNASLIVVAEPRAALAQAAALWFGAQPDTMVAVTGTNGKTSVASFTRQIWNALGFDAVNIGTTGVEGSFAAAGTHTTPDPLTLHALFRDMAEAGVTHAAMEASSHGLDQYRLDGVRLAAAGFTNFTQDHLDYHGTMEAYFEAKARLFHQVLDENGTVVVNLDDPKGAAIAAIAEAREIEVITVGEGAPNARLRITARRLDERGQDLLFTWQDDPFRARLSLIGGFQAMNVLVAAGLVIAAGAAPDAVFATLPRLQGVRGRMQLAATRANGAPVFVDYAHTPDALRTALLALRPHVMGRLHVVFGAGGDRDRAKRPLMGAEAAAHADCITVTDDNPRSEDPAAIRAAILEACPHAREIGDRAEAILRAVADLAPGDALLIAGKGHETGQIVGDVTYPFDDLEQASLAVSALEGQQ